MLTHKQIHRFWSRVDVGPTAECWHWTGCTSQAGYAMLTLNNVTHYGHRLAYELVRGPIGDGLTIDHMCHDPDACHLGKNCPHRSCCNPWHMVPATLEENGSRTARSICRRDLHPMTPENVMTGQRCRACNYAWQRARRQGRSVLTT